MGPKFFFLGTTPHCGRDLGPPWKILYYMKIIRYRLITMIAGELNGVASAVHFWCMFFFASLMTGVVLTLRSSI